MLTLDHLTTLDVTVGETHEIGELPREGFRRVISITGGTMSGEALSGVVLPGGADWNTARPDGTAHAWARYTVCTDDGTCIGVINRGAITGEEGEPRAVTAVTLEAPEGDYAWLNDAVVVGTLRALADGSGVRIGLYLAVDAS